MPELTTTDRQALLSIARRLGMSYQRLDAAAAGEMVSRLREIAGLERPEVDGVATYCGERLVSIQVDVRPGDDFRTMQSVPVKVTINPV